MVSHHINKKLDQCFNFVDFATTEELKILSQKKKNFKSQGSADSAEADFFLPKQHFGFILGSCCPWVQPPQPAEADVHTSVRLP
jgi:hypothetical protein